MKKIDEKVIETIRFLSADGVQKANSGHPGLPLGCATMSYVLWKKFLKGSSVDTKWVDRDRFVLSAGHGSMLLYSLLHLFNYDLSIDDLKNFRQFGSKTPGHPEYGMTPGIETTTGPLGQGISNAVGMAIAEARLAAKFNKSGYNIIDHYTYVIAGDGDMMEGISSEAASLAGHLGLGKLIVMYDDNSITIDGTTDVSFSEDVEERFKSYQWEVIKVSDGNNMEEVENAIEKSRYNTNKPSLIMVKNIIGFGSPNKSNTSKVHGSPLGDDEIALMKEKFGWDPEEKFFVPDEVREYMKELTDKREIDRFMWEEKFEDYLNEFPEMAKEWDVWFEYDFPEEVSNSLSMWKELDVKEASRVSGGKVLNHIARDLPNIVGGSADLNESTKTYMKALGDFTSKNRDGNNVFFGIREHAMAGIINGIALHGGLRTFGSTFLVFSDYMKPSIRLAGLMGLPVVYIFTHDSIGVGEDGPTHQPIEHLAMLRGIPNLDVYRPANGKETGVAFTKAFKKSDGPSALVLSRQNLEPLGEVTKAAHYGAYVISPERDKNIDGILIGSGSEVQLLIKAQEELWESGYNTRVVSMLSWEVFDRQDESYKKEVIPPEIENRLYVEAGLDFAWEKYVGINGKKIGMTSYGESAPGAEVMKHFGFTVENIVKRIKE
jgi:transketolase